MSHRNLAVLGAFAVLLITIGALSAALAHNAQSTVEVKVNARQLSDGRVEFALQHRDGSGWSDRVLSPSRYFPSNIGHDRWVSSSTFTFTLSAPGNGEDMMEEGSPAPVKAQPDSQRSLRGEIGSSTGKLTPFSDEVSGLHLEVGERRIHYSHEIHEHTDFWNTTVTLTDHSWDPHHHDVSMEIGCHHDHPTPSVKVWAWFEWYGTGEVHKLALNRDRRTIATFGDGERFTLDTHSGSALIVLERAWAFIEHARTQQKVTLELPLIDGDLEIEFSLDQVFETAVDHIIADCEATHGEGSTSPVVDTSVHREAVSASFTDVGGEGQLSISCSPTDHHSTVEVSVLVAGLFHRLNPNGALLVNMGGPAQGGHTYHFTADGNRATLVASEALSFLHGVLLPDHTVHHVRIRVPTLPGGWKWLSFDIQPSDEERFRGCLGL